MRRICSIFLLSFIALNSVSQERKIIQRDTIHIRGKVMDENGKPLSNTGLLFFSESLTKASAHNIISTDSSGNFLMKGASLNDTIVILHQNYSQTRFFNKGARYMFIRAPYFYGDYADTGFVIKAKRISVKPVSSFEKSDEMIFDADGFRIFPYFPGGIDKFNKYIYDKLTYPLKAIENNIEGTIVAGFTIGKTGEIENVEIINGLGYGCDDVVIGILKGMPKWKPGIDFGGRREAIKATVSIKFILTD